MKPIIIATTPRTGSTLLLLSLDQHPGAICAGELCHADPSQTDPRFWSARQRDDWNLAKLFAFEAGESYFDDILSRGTVVYLYRRDLDSQLASWRRSCETGIWIPPFQVEPTEFDQAWAMHLIDLAQQLFADRADIALAYEDLIDDWDCHITTILTAAHWPPAPLPKATAQTPPAPTSAPSHPPSPKPAGFPGTRA